MCESHQCLKSTLRLFITIRTGGKYTIYRINWRQVGAHIRVVSLQIEYPNNPVSLQTDRVCAFQLQPTITYQSCIRLWQTNIRLLHQFVLCKIVVTCWVLYGFLPVTHAQITYICEIMWLKSTAFIKVVCLNYTLYSDCNSDEWQQILHLIRSLAVCDTTVASKRKLKLPY